MSDHEKELKELQRQIQSVVLSQDKLDKPFFAKKVMRAVKAYEARKATETHLKIYQLLRVALFMGLLLFPTLTEAII